MRKEWCAGGGSPHSLRLLYSVGSSEPTGRRTMFWTETGTGRQTLCNEGMVTGARGLSLRSFVLRTLGGRGS